ncbi:hypothetical protein F5X68DRAFT_166866 [Plectosphaerella plurivora]|uniref:Zn(2)-C6 fungal-type domain-containing protein n=1 Tax=Plectosphaerella plurivora TaxID=936078 RepID=A0A9P9ACD1_9PEZI|nr:hypothetical protein F5X68DRAFT_166866 [Plectosphaerella plurivora]
MRGCAWSQTDAPVLLLANQCGSFGPENVIQVWLEKDAKCPRRKKIDPPGPRRIPSSLGRLSPLHHHLPLAQTQSTAEVPRSRNWRPKGKPRSKGACLTCKKRKVKAHSDVDQCDETHPTCNNCNRRSRLCRYSIPEHECSSPAAVPSSPNGAVLNGQGHQGAGRPVEERTVPSIMEGPRASSASSSGRQSTPKSSDFNLTDADLMLHFNSHTGPSLTTHDQFDLFEFIHRFWTWDPHKLETGYPFLLHLTHALSARHMLHRMPETDPRQAASLESLIQSHTALGISQMTPALAALDIANVRPLYVGAMLMCLGAFAAGPDGPQDLLICAIDEDGPPNTWLAAARGLLWMAETIPKEILFTGHMSSEKRHLTTNVEVGCNAIDWRPALQGVKMLVYARDEALQIQGEEQRRTADARLTALNMLEAAYEGISGRGGDGSLSVGPEHQMAPRWLYMADDDFVRLVKARDPIALVLLAYWAMVLKEEGRWYILGWPKHILAGTRDLLHDDPEDTRLLAWPTRVMDEVRSAD